MSKLALLAMALTVVGCASGSHHDEVARVTAAEGPPPGAVGMPAPEEHHGPPPGAIGMPAPHPGHGTFIPPILGVIVPQDHACRRAAGVRAVSEAMDEIQNSGDCEAEHADPIKTFTAYHVVVHCDQAGDFAYFVHTKQSSRGCRATNITADNQK